MDIIKIRKDIEAVELWFWRRVLKIPWTEKKPRNNMRDRATQVVNDQIKLIV